MSVLFARYITYKLYRLTDRPYRQSWSGLLFTRHLAILLHCKFAACRIFHLPYFNSLYTHKGQYFHVYLLNIKPKRNSLPPAGIELNILEYKTITLATAPERHSRNQLLYETLIRKLSFQMYKHHSTLNTQQWNVVRL